MAVTYGMQELYGGTMTVELPVNLIDSSDLRQIPDNQEVFLSPTTLTSVVFEINEYVEPSTTAGFNPTTTTTTTTQPDGTTTTTTVTAANDTSSSTEADAEAAKYHFTDVIAEPDTLADDLPEPQSVTMQHPSLASFPASILSGNINSVDTRRDLQQNQPSQSQLAVQQASSSRALLESIVHQIQLLVRLKDYDTDLCVRVNVPLKEIARDDGQIATEVTLAKEVLARVVATLEIRDFGLFGED
ncbi:hypothetical protein PV11_04117 [Exophiala sideris]|uniref:Uncharacterized protein n=1 Tax=Exophiala sideris TaxID=1016849 RepID=A0A0D1X305_9EURO|nr:hypothetical protein PV11_04117 [Exophiala sideris]